MKLKKRRLHIHQFLTLVLLWVFALAIIPWSAIHHHDEVKVSFVEKHCTHQLHLKTSHETCLICKAHFEKDYIISSEEFITYLTIEIVNLPTAQLSHSYAALISTSLRGPPVFS